MALFQKLDPAGASLFEGEASFGVLMDAARDTALYADNFNAAEHAREEAFDEAIASIEAATGVKLKNPQVLKPATLWTPMDVFQPFVDKVTGYEDPFDTWEKRIDELSDQFPDHAEVLDRARLSAIEDAAKSRTREVSDTQARLAATRDDWGATGAALAGGFAGALRDPMTLATLPFGLPGAGGRTVAGKILSTAWREAVVSGATEAAMQPKVQGWREEAGLPHGFAEAAANVAGATVLGGALGGGLRGAIELPGAVRRRFGAEMPDGAKVPRPEKIANDLADLRDDLKPATRAAVDVMEQDRAVQASIRSEFGDSFGAEMARAMEAAESFADSVGKPQQATFKPSPSPRRTVRRPQSLTEFLAQRGIMDEGGELSAFDLDKLVLPGSGRLVRKEGGLPLDRAREMAAEAGYIHGFGSREDAVASSTVADLIDALHEEQGGKRIFAMGDEIDAEQWRVEGEAIEQHHAREQVRREIFEASNGVLTENEAVRALRLVDGGMDVDEAVERVILYDDTSALETGLETASDPFEPGGAEFEAQLMALEGQYDPADVISDVMLVDEEGRIVAGVRSLEDALGDADRGLDLSRLVEACKLS